MNYAIEINCVIHYYCFTYIFNIADCGNEMRRFRTPHYRATAVGVKDEKGYSSRIQNDKNYLRMR